MRKKILIIGLYDLSRSPRVLTQIKALKDKYFIDTIGLSESGLEQNFYKIKKESIFIKILSLPLLLFRLYNFYYWDKNKSNLVSKMKNKKYDLIIAHEVRMLPLAFRFAKNSKIILDAHEYSPNNFDDNLLWKIFIKNFYVYLCDNYLKRCNKVITVCDEIANLYNKNFKISCEVITNAADYIKIEPLVSNSKKIKIIHHGNASRSRRLELMIDMMDYLDERFELYLMLVANRTNKIYFNKLKRLANKHDNIHFLKPVPYNEIVRYSNQFDIGLLFFPPTNLNLKYCLPNKLFEFIQSRLCVVSGPSIEINKYIQKYNLGIVSDSFDPKNMAKYLNSLNNNKINNYKHESHSSAKLLSSATNQKKY